ncbi:MAG TPA: hypothetical protein VE860_17575, partial [Chthoniobacterales bacterium]|nr:hypothetical protein [Chthoniobacterales bacterium]
MKFGASSWPFQWDPPYENCIKRVASLGFRAIELIAPCREIDFLLLLLNIAPAGVCVTRPAQ